MAVLLSLPRCHGGVTKLLDAITHEVSPVAMFLPLNFGNTRKIICGPMMAILCFKLQNIDTCPNFGVPTHQLCPRHCAIARLRSVLVAPPSKPLGHTIAVL